MAHFKVTVKIEGKWVDFGVIEVDCLEEAEAVMRESLAELGDSSWLQEWKVTPLTV